MINALRQALALAGLPGASGPIEPLPDTGLAHLHLRLVGTGRLARLPKHSQVGLDASAHLAYEAACFERAAPSGHVPDLHAVLPPSPGLPRGALLVDEVQGQPLRLDEDLQGLVAALGAIHALPLPAGRPPLFDPVDVLAALAAEIDRQGLNLPLAGLAPATALRIDTERERLACLLRQPARPPRHLIAFDTHPGNFLRRADGRVMLLDLEKARYGAAALDLAHATLYTSTTWNQHNPAVLSDAQVLHAATGWLRCLASAGIDPEPERCWIAPLRRAMWLWSITWCALWRVQSARPSGNARGGPDWSADLSADALVAHVRGRVDHYLAPDTVHFVCDQADRLALALQD